MKKNLSSRSHSSGDDNPGKDPGGQKIEIPAIEGKYTVDDKRRTASLKNGFISIYIIPQGMKVSSEDAMEMMRY